MILRQFFPDNNFVAESPWEFSMDRRKFLVKTGKLSAALTVANSSIMPAMELHAKPGHAGRNGNISLANEFIAWKMEWREGKRASASSRKYLFNRHSSRTSRAVGSTGSDGF